MKWMKTYTLALLWVVPLLAHAQKEKFPLKAGNEAYKAGEYERAVGEFERARELNPESKAATFNAGNAWQRIARSMQEVAMAAQSDSLKQAGLQSSIEIAKRAAANYEMVAKAAEGKDEKNKANYNLGNAQLMSNQVDQAIESYKNALRHRPDDEDARYNLAYAQWLKKQQEKQPNQRQNDQQQDEQNQQDQQQEQDKDNQQQQQEQQKRPENQLSREEAEQMLDAMMKQEKDLMDKVQKQRHKVQRIKIEKDW
jgi:tetratricopeptide (TPR) repeat protein